MKHMGKSVGALILTVLFVVGLLPLGALAADLKFTDVPADAWYAEPVAWAVQEGVTKGTSETTFSPDDPCTRAQAVAFLYRAAGEPSVAGQKNPFTDVKESDYFYNAVLWAVQEGITKGTSETTFSPEMTCTRAHIVTFLSRWKDAGAPKDAKNPFTDVPASTWYTDAVLWAAVLFSLKNKTNKKKTTSFMQSTSWPNINLNQNYRKAHI